jgi:hypothetical protein
MKTKAFVLGTLLSLGVVASAQENTPTPKFEVGANYTYTRVNPGGTLGSYNANGGSAYVEYNLNKVVGLVADLGATRVGDVNGIQLQNTSFDYLFGPRFNWRRSGRFTPYVQTLFGGERYSNAFNPNATNPSLGTSQNHFAAAFGGGLDVRVTDHIAFKPIQIEYLTAQVPAGTSNQNFAQNNLRYSAGVVFRFGAK